MHIFIQQDPYEIFSRLRYIARVGLLLLLLLVLLVGAYAEVTRRSEHGFVLALGVSVR